MSGWNRLVLFSLPPLLLLTLAAYYSYFFRYAQTPGLVLPKVLKTIIPFPGWENLAPGNAVREWYKHDGTPLFYEAWRVKPGPVPPEPTARSELLEHDARVACWPSTGGVWIKRASRPDLDFLRLSYKENSPRRWPYDGAEEDMFCAKMRQIGAEFWELPPHIHDFSCPTLEQCVTPTVKADVGFAWPSDGGAIAVNLTEARQKWGAGLQGWTLAKDMDERAFAMNRMGGVWCFEKPEICQDLWCRQYSHYCEESEIFWK